MCCWWLQTCCQHLQWVVTQDVHSQHRVENLGHKGESGSQSSLHQTQAVQDS